MSNGVTDAVVHEDCMVHKLGPTGLQILEMQLQEQISEAKLDC